MQLTPTPVSALYDALSQLYVFAASSQKHFENVKTFEKLVLSRACAAKP